MNTRPPCVRRPLSAFGTAMAALIVAAMTAPSMAAIVPGTDYDAIAGGALFAGPLTNDFVTPPAGSGDIGDLTGRVLLDEDSGIYTYELTVTPHIDNISEFNTTFAVLGFNGVAGWSFSDAAAAGGNGDSTDIEIALDDEGRLNWLVNGDWFDAGESITFFFQSTLPPRLGDYGLHNTEVGEAECFAPIPAPAALPAGLVLLSLGGLLRRRVGV